MLKQALLLIILSNLLLLGGCSRKLDSQNACLTRNWESMGYRDGSTGRPMQSLAEEIVDCREQGVMVDSDSYVRGWNRGVREYCTIDKGRLLGAAGIACPNLCPADLDAHFRLGWEQGMQQYCTSNRAFQEGLQGNTYLEHCPKDVQVAYEDVYTQGRAIYDQRAQLRSRIKTVNHLIQLKIKEMHRFESAQDDVHARALKTEIAQLKEERRALEDHMVTIIRLGQ